MCSPARLLIPQDCLFCYDCLYPWAIFHPISISFKRLFHSWLSLASFSAATPVIPKISQNDSKKQLGKDVADVHDIAKAAKKIWKHMTFCCWASQPGITAKRSVTDDFFPTLEEIDFNGKLVALFGCGDQKITQNTSAMHWAPSATSLNRAAQLSLVTGQPRATTSKRQKVWLMMTTLSVWLSTKIVSRN